MDFSIEKNFLYTVKFLSRPFKEKTIDYTVAVDSLSGRVCNMYRKIPCFRYLYISFLIFDVISRK